MDFDQFKTIELQLFIYNRMVADNKTCEKKFKPMKLFFKR